jgi:hypothetical protein
MRSSLATIARVVPGTLIALASLSTAALTAETLRRELLWLEPLEGASLSSDAGVALLLEGALTFAEGGWLAGSLSLLLGLVAVLLLVPVWVEAKRARRRLQVCALGAVALGMLAPVTVSVLPLGLPGVPERHALAATVDELMEADLEFRASWIAVVGESAPKFVQIDEGRLVGTEGRLVRSVTTGTGLSASRQRNVPPTPLDAEQRAEEAELAELREEEGALWNQLNALLDRDLDETPEAASVAARSAALSAEIDAHPANLYGVLWDRERPLRLEAATVGMVFGAEGRGWWADAANVSHWEQVAESNGLVSWRGRPDLVLEAAATSPGFFKRVELRAVTRTLPEVVFELDVDAQGHLVALRRVERSGSIVFRHELEVRYLAPLR